MLTVVFLWVTVATAGACLAAAAGAVRRQAVVRRRLGHGGRRPVPATTAAPAAVHRWVDELCLPWAAAAAWRGWLGAGAVMAVGGAWLGGPVLGLAGAVAAAAGPAAARRLAGDRRLRALDLAIPSALETVARSLRSGSSLLHAVDDAAGAAPGLLAADLGAVTTRVRLGATLPAALDAWAERRPRPGVRFAVAALALAAETGGASARSVDGVATTLRERHALDREVSALSAQARLSALVIGLAPLAFAAFAAATDPRTATFLFRAPAGLACLGAGLALDAAGAWWMHRLTREQP